jgi:hypothetical protein
MNLRTANCFILIVFYFLATGCNSMICGTAEEPGNIPNAKLVILINTALEENITSSSYPASPDMLPSAATRSRVWLKEIASVTLHCNCNPDNDGKENRRLIDITLVNGVVLKDIYTSERCLYQMSKPLIMKVLFREGAVVEVFTDGSEKRESVDYFKGDVYMFAERVLREDWNRRHDLYFPRAKTAEEKAKEWE